MEFADPPCGGQTPRQLRLAAQAVVIFPKKVEVILLEKSSQSYFFVLLPFLKSINDVQIGNYFFRNSDNLIELNSTQKEELEIIKEMLYVRNFCKIDKSVYSLITLDINNKNEIFYELKNIRNFIAYCYLGPRHEFGDIFFPKENSCMYILEPKLVPKSLVFPDNNTKCLSNVKDIKTNQLGEIPGYSCIIDFKQQFNLAKGGQINSPSPYLCLNIYQNLDMDIDKAVKSRVDYKLISKYLSVPHDNALQKYFLSLDWFIKANSNLIDHATALINLSIAFESLLELPADNKTDRLIDAVSMLLGRTKRLNIWAKQFYNARSQIVHEGSLDIQNFKATDSLKKGSGLDYQSLLSYGRQIYQLCLSAILTGYDLSKKTKLEEKFITNEERFKKIISLVDDEEIEINEKFEQIDILLNTIENYRYISEPNLKIPLLVTAISAVSKCILSANLEILPIITDEFKVLCSQNKSKDLFIELDAISKVSKIEYNSQLELIDQKITIFISMAKIIDSFCFMHYYWLKEKRELKDNIG